MKGVKRIMPAEFWADLESIYPTRGGGRKLAEKYKEFGADPGFVCRMAKSRGIQAERSTRLAFYRESSRNGHFEAMVREWVPQIGGVKRLSEMFGIPMTMINTAATQLGISSPAATLQRYHLENLRTDYFNTLDSKRAYWLGYLWADGCVAEDKRRGGLVGLYLGCKTSDEGHILNLRSELRSQHAICRAFKKDKSGRVLLDKNGEPIQKTSVYITSLQLAETLRDTYGILPRKSGLDPPFPDWVSLGLLPHFSRGVFDGDGGCYSGVNRYNRLTQSLYYLGSMSFIGGLLHQITSTLDVFLAKPHLYRGIWLIGWYSLIDIRKLYQWMYPDPGVVCLPRKRDYLQKMLS